MTFLTDPEVYCSSLHVCHSEEKKKDKWEVAHGG